MSKSETTPAPVTFEQAREGEDTHQWIARLHRENVAAQKPAFAHTESARLAMRDAVNDLRAMRAFVTLPPTLAALVKIVEEGLLEDADRVE